MPTIVLARRARYMRWNLEKCHIFDEALEKGSQKFGFQAQTAEFFIELSKDSLCRLLTSTVGNRALTISTIAMNSRFAQQRSLGCYRKSFYSPYRCTFSTCVMSCDKLPSWKIATCMTPCVARHNGHIWNMVYKKFWMVAATGNTTKQRRCKGRT